MNETFESSWWKYQNVFFINFRKLHENEQILRSELTEKRELLAKLRQELEYTRETWNVVKVKTADSEREWHALRAEFAARRKLFKSAYHLCSGGRLTDLEGDCDGPGKEFKKQLGWTYGVVNLQYFEQEWHALRAEFAARRKLFKSAYHLCTVQQRMLNRSI